MDPCKLPLLIEGHLALTTELMICGFAEANCEHVGSIPTFSCYFYYYKFHRAQSESGRKGGAAVRLGLRPRAQARVGLGLGTRLSRPASPRRPSHWHGGPALPALPVTGRPPRPWPPASPRNRRVGLSPSPWQSRPRPAGNRDGPGAAESFMIRAN